ncbi:hypothetical protein [Arthrobacter sp. UM1]|uniref:hypothetical protein n=1 Tax=Arthrobacter sp. UM1 TaxID=2766776 RepID=UPI001CF6847E|nr:hypothetical protein [Arthrobacter sp. UM1]MCB4207588.1 hypothetical protein [Arthrobacter sp. UM1]
MTLPDGRTLTTEFTAAERSAMERDGLIRSVLPDVWVACGTEETPALRARLASFCIPPRLRRRVVVGWASAAWVYGWAAPPARLEVLIDQSSRTTSAHRAAPRLLIHEVRDPLDRSVNFGPVFVSDDVRTILDVASRCAPDEAEAILRTAFRSVQTRRRLEAYLRLERSERVQRGAARVRKLLREG